MGEIHWTGQRGWVGSTLLIMKKLLTLSLFLLVFTAFGAGLTISTTDGLGIRTTLLNPTNTGATTFPGGSSVSSNGVFTGNGGGLTPVLGDVSIASTSQSRPTNNLGEIVLYGSSLEAVNSRYVISSTGSGFILYTNVLNNGFIIVSNINVEFGGAPVYEVTNVAYASSDHGGGFPNSPTVFVSGEFDMTAQTQWAAWNETNSSPRTMFKFNYTSTNSYPELSSTNTIQSAPVTHALIVDGHVGSDTRGRRGYYAYKTIGAALLSATNFDHVIVRPGTYDEDVTLPIGCTLQGEGGSVIEGYVIFRDYCTLRSLTVMSNAHAIGDLPTLGLLIDGCTLGNERGVDSLLLSVGTNCLIKNTLLVSAWDNFVQTATSEDVITFENCVFRAIYHSNAIPSNPSKVTHNIVGNSSGSGPFNATRVVLNNCTLLAKNGQAANSGCLVGDASVQVTLHNTTLTAFTTNGTCKPIVGCIVSGDHYANGLLGLSTTNALSFAPSAATNSGYLYPSSTVLYWVTPAATNIVEFDTSPFTAIRTNDYVLGTRYTNTVSGGYTGGRAWVSASFQLTAAAAGTATVTMFVETSGVRTNRLQISAGPLASLVTTEPLGMPVGPGAIWYFSDDDSGVGSSSAIVTLTSTYDGM